MVLLWRVYLFLYGCLLWQMLFAEQKFFKDKLDSPEALERSLRSLNKVCIENSHSQKIPFYLLCFQRSVFMIDYDFKSNVVTETQVLGHFDEEKSVGSSQLYVSAEENCHASDDSGVVTNRTSVHVRIECCQHNGDKVDDKGAGSASSGRRNAAGLKQTSRAVIQSVTTSDSCTYHVVVCSEVVCMDQSESVKVSEKGSKRYSKLNSEYSLTRQQQEELKQRTRDMFYHAYTSYLENAFPEGELRPVSCEGGPFELIKIPFVTLIDALDTLVIMGDFSEFKRATRLLVKKLPNFDFDVNVSLFETTIRILGGLLSAHLFSVDAALSIYERNAEEDIYRGELLTLAVDIGDRLLPAFATKTGIPYGTVNLRSGVPKGETKIASTAGAGTLLIEFEILSILTGNEKYGKAALAALEGIYSRKSDFDLVGKHINTESGQWLETLSGVGSNSDSFYEYLLKGYSLLQHHALYGMFSKTYRAIKQLILIDDEWFSEVDMYSGKLQRRRVENLDAFWPGMEALLGNTESAALQLNAMYSIWNDLGFMPEELDQFTWESGKSATNPHYALRPELIESTYYQYRVSGHRSWLTAGKQFLQSIEKYTKTGCGYASINDVASLELHDSMPSFFLSETCKYMYLLFDEENFFHSRPFLLSTEAHPFDLNQLHLIRRRDQRDLLPSHLLQEEATGDNFQEREEVRHMLLTQRRQRRKRHERSKMLMSTAFLASETARIPQQVSDASASDDSTMTLPLVCAVPSYSSLLASSYSKILLSREGGKLKRFPSLFSAALYLDDESLGLLDHRRADDDANPPDLTSEASALSQRRVPSYRRGALSRSLKNAITLLKHRSTLANPSSGNEGVKKCSLASVKGQAEEGSVAEATVSKTNTNSAPSLRSTSSEQTLLEDVAGIKTLELSLGSLGQFRVQVLPDGFHIWNKQDDRQIEISNVGKKSIFVREVERDEGVRTIVARLAGTVDSCTIEATINPRGENNSTAVWRRHCALANFGPLPPLRVSGELLIAEESEMGLLCEKATSHSQNRASKVSHQVANLLKKSFLPAVSQSAIAALLEKGDELFANNLNWWKKLKEASLLQFGGLKNNGENPSPEDLSTVQAKAQQNTESEDTPRSANIDIVERDLATETSNEPSSAHDDIPQNNDNSDKDDLRARIVLVKRGSCLFEEKATNAQSRGANALIIQNHENNLFIMAGKRDVEESQMPVASTEDKDEAADSTSSDKEVLNTKTSIEKKIEEIKRYSTSLVKIPTVLVSDLDSRELIQLHSSSPFSASHVTIDIQAVHSLLMSDLFGSVQYPKVWMTKSAIYVHPKGLWAAYFKAEKGGDWQMYLVDKRDATSLRLIPPMTIKNQRGIKVSTTSTLLQSPERIYAQLVRRKCPKQVKVSADGKYVQIR